MSVLLTLKIFHTFIKNETMLKIIKTLGENECHRHDGASLRMIKICKLSIARHVLLLNNSVRQGALR